LIKSQNHKSGVKESTTSMQGLGYKEICAYLFGRASKDEAIDMLKQGTRQFDKRQITWFKHQADEGVWVDVDSDDMATIAQKIADGFV